MFANTKLSGLLQPGAIDQRFSILKTARIVVLVVSSTFATSTSVSAEESSIPVEDQKRVASLSKAILSCQLAEGAIPVVGYREIGQPAYIDAYFANLACLGLLSADTNAQSPQTRKYVEQWLDWCVSHQEQDGTFNRFSGAIDNHHRLSSNSRVVPPDSHDSYAAGFLTVVATWAAKYQQPLKPELVAACRNSFEVLKRCRDKENGLYWNFCTGSTPEGVVPAQYLLDNIEVHQGLASAHLLFSKSGDTKLASVAHQYARELADRMHEFWSANDRYFVCMYGDKLAGIPWGKQVATAEGLSTVSALAFFENVAPATRETLWNKFWRDHGRSLTNSIATDKYVSEDPTVERVYFAALRSASKERQRELQAAVRKRADELLKRQSQLEDPAKSALPYPYVHRYGMLIQALIAQEGRFPAELPRVPLDKTKSP